MLTPVEAATPADVLVEPVTAGVAAVEAPLLDDPGVTGELTAVPAVAAVEETLFEPAGVAAEDPAFALVGVALAVTGHTVCKC